MLGYYVVVDLAHKVVGVGSVGLRAYVALLQGNDPSDVVFLQVKQARRSCVARFVHGDTAWHAHQGQRVVEYQQTLQTVSDPLLGWTSVGGRDYYVRQFRDMKGAITVDGMDGSALMDYSRVCGTLLAKGHARSTGATVLSGYLGKGDSADRAFAASPGPTPTRPRPTTRRCARPSPPAASRPRPGSSVAQPSQRAERVERVSTLELFFDLVFVFTITQLTAVLSDDPTRGGCCGWCSCWA